MKFKKSELLKIIKEEIQLQERRKQKILKESLTGVPRSAATSKMEIKELLSAYHRNAGGFPPNVFKLSILFPILERCGLREIVEDYKAVKEGKLMMEEEQDAMSILEDVRQSIMEIQNGDFS